jgi:hypothetical protein
LSIRMSVVLRGVSGRVSVLSQAAFPGPNGCANPRAYGAEASP